MRFRSAQRVRHRLEFERIYATKTSVADDTLVVYARENGLSHARLGLSVSRKIGGAVTRNRWKRRIREAFRLDQSRIPTGIDLIVIPRHSTEPDFQELVLSLRELSHRVAKKLRRSSNAKQ